MRQFFDAVQICRYLLRLIYCVLAMITLFGCSIHSKKKKAKYGVHDHPLFIDYCLQTAEHKRVENRAFVSIFEEPFEDAFREKRLEMLKNEFPRLYKYALEHEETSSIDLWLLAELERTFGPLQGSSIVLVGAQQGRLPLLLTDLYQVANITIIDLPACLELAKSKLKDKVSASLHWVTPQQISHIEQADFLVSNAIFSRLSRDWQDRLIHAVVAKVKGGCILFKPTPRHWGVKTWDRYQFIERLKKQRNVEERSTEGLTANSDSLIVFSSIGS